MKVFMTGATGFIGGQVARKLRMRGDEVLTLVRDPEKAARLRDVGCKLVKGDLSDQAALRNAIEGSDAVIHGAAIYEVGIRRSRRRPMYESNVLGTENVLRASLEAKVPKVVYISTVGAFGNTHGEVVDESYRHPGQSFTSYYEETKYKAHEIARRLIDDEELPCVIVQPGGVYGPQDHSEIGNTIKMFLRGRLPLIPFAELGFNLVHVDDVADGVLLALDKGKAGEAYVLGGQISTMRELLEIAAHVAGKRPPRGSLPTMLIKASAPFGPVVGPILGFPPNMRELVSSSDGVTFWAKHDKAIKDLGYSPRGLEEGLRDTLAAEGKLS